MSLQTLFLDGFPPFRVERPRGWQADEDSLGWDFAHSKALICPICLKQWAILHFEEDREHHIEGAYCERCLPSLEDSSRRGRVCIPGSIFGSGTYFIDRPLLAVLPEPLLRREVALTFRQMEAGE